MNEPDEDLESTLPEEPLPERDFLLEALVDAETEAKPRRRFSKTLIAACVFSGLGVWQIVHVSKGGEPVFQLAPKAKSAPSKQRSDSREPIGRVLPSTDPISAYLERAKRGMTDQEIRWMIEDFQAAGLDEEEHSLEGTLRAKQQLWYLEALTEALQLSQEQRAQAKTKMDTMRVAEFELLEKEFEEEAANYPNSHPDVRTALESTYLAVVSKPDWLMKDAYAPWNLCDLTKAQDQLTMHRWRENERQSALKSDSVETDAPYWMHQAETKLDPLSGNVIDLGDANPYQFAFEGHAILGRILVYDVFPLTPGQKDPISPTGLGQARCLQPPQLRVAMLNEPEAASKLLSQLDNPATQMQSAEDLGTGDTTAPTDDLPPNPVQPETPVDPLPEPDPK